MRGCWLGVILLVGLSSGSTLAAARELLEPTASKYVIAVFGDSLSDNGNDFRAAGLPDPAVYYQGRFSNGPVWYDYLSQAYASNANVEFYNYAHGGAFACSENSYRAAYPFIVDLDNQTAAFIADVKLGRVPVDANTKLVAIQWIGSNDFLNVLNAALKQNRFPTQPELAAAIKRVITCRLASLQVLAGALRMPLEIAVVPTSPLAIAPSVPVSLKPAFMQIEYAMGSATVTAVEALRKAFTKAEAGQVGYGVHVHNIGINSRWITGLMYQVRPKFKYYTASCFVNPNSSLAITPNTKTCNNSNDYAFFDHSHPTTLFHKWFGLYGLMPRLQRIGLLP